MFDDCEPTGWIDNVVVFIKERFVPKVWGLGARSENAPPTNAKKEQELSALKEVVDRRLDAEMARRDNVRANTTSSYPSNPHLPVQPSANALGRPNNTALYPSEQRPPAQPSASYLAGAPPVPAPNRSHTASPSEWNPAERGGMVGRSDGAGGAGAAAAFARMALTRDGMVP
ncbi:hypothetical protein M427DRAFT_146902 [Gonapodya prolifera JEL478]|uniref:Uncharacterized protein n=1 Tax=Gonapodya prolifera (strain JEL478) TaxID=1344416 RepID=A0A139A7Z8_GONPJ|nr:hypothetical protein M427DRAFT_146902 [Gonapodya prolifera JEL478]|eukprot:KXS12834.1 hypothetical protein M427DRAFT_146902 [Gonapodya prolifera JEL478]